MVARLTDEQARRVMVDAGFEPLVDYPGGRRGWLCRCLNCRREVAPSYQNVRKGKGCAWCSRTRVDPGEARHDHSGPDRPRRRSPRSRMAPRRLMERCYR